MTLVPIIYTCLLIFSSFLLFVFIISYVSYKAKAVVRSSHNVKPISKHQLAFAAYTIPINYRTVEPVVKQRQSSLPTTINNNFPAKDHITQNIVTRNTEWQNIDQDDYNTRSNPAEKYYKNKRSIDYDSNTTDRFIEQRRFESMNETKNIKTMEERNNYEDLPKHESNLAEMNLLNYYSDNNDYEMVALSASRIRKAI